MVCINMIHISPWSATQGLMAGAGRLLRVGAEYDPSIEPRLEGLFEERYSVKFANYPVRESWLLEPAHTVAARPHD